MPHAETKLLTFLRCSAQPTLGYSLEMSVNMIVQTCASNIQEQLDKDEGDHLTKNLDQRVSSFQKLQLQ